MVPVPCGDTNTEMNLGDARDKTMLEVWFKLNDNDVDAVDLHNGTNVRKFRDKVKKKWANAINCAPSQLKVFAPHGSEYPLRANSPVPPSAFKDPLIVVTPPSPPPAQQHSESVRCSPCVFLYSKFLLENVARLQYPPIQLPSHRSR